MATDPSGTLRGRPAPVPGASGRSAATSSAAPLSAAIPRVLHICTNAAGHAVGDCREGCVSYCGASYRGGRTRGSAGVAPIDICVICQTEKAERR